MQGENNVWLETWRDASPRPAKRQKRLFNESKEAELVSIIFYPGSKELVVGYMLLKNSNVKYSFLLWVSLELNSFCQFC